MTWVLIGLAALAALVALMAIVGAFLPRGHTATRRRRFRQAPETLFALISDPKGYPAWRGDLRSVELLPAPDGRLAWREVGKHGRIAFEQVEVDPPRRLVVRIADQGLPFGGSWTYEVAPADGGAELSITEHGEVYNPVFRFMSRFVFGHAATLEAFLGALARKLGEA